MTSTELEAYREEVGAQLRQARIGTVHEPVAIICAEALEGGASAKPGERITAGSRWRMSDRGRTYPWGTALSEATTHSELATLRRFLLIDGLLQIKQATDRTQPDSSGCSPPRPPLAQPQPDPATPTLARAATRAPTATSARAPAQPRPQPQPQLHPLACKPALPQS